MQLETPMSGEEFAVVSGNFQRPGFSPQKAPAGFFGGAPRKPLMEAQGAAFIVGDCP